MPFPEYLDRVAKGLGRPVSEMFDWVNPKPLGSARRSARSTRRGRSRATNVILKVVKPHVYVVLKRDARLLGFFGSFLQVFFSRYQPKKVLDEFAEYTLREVDLRREADNAEQFALNFADEPDIAFPKIYREYSSPARDDDGAVRGHPARHAREPRAPRGCPRAHRGPGRQVDHPDALRRRLLPRRPARGQPLRARHRARRETARSTRSSASSTSAWSATSTATCGGRCSTTTSRSSPATPRTRRATSRP